MSMSLVVIAGLERGRQIRLREGDILQLGCSQNLDIASRFRDPGVARVHCEIQVRDGQVHLLDASTPTGTFLNGSRIQSELLHSGDVIRIGSTEIRFVQEASEASESASDTTVRKRRTQVDLPQVDSASDPLAGLVGKQFTHYRLDLVLGKGSWGRVYRARDSRDGRLVALKVLKPEFSSDAVVIQHFASALKMTLPLVHPHLVLHYGAGKVGPLCWIGMELVEGKSLTQIIRRAESVGQVDVRTAVKLALQLAEALECLQECYIAHGAVTPQNVLVRDLDRRVKLGDTLLALAQQDMSSSQRQPLGESLASMPYWPPEKLLDDCKIDIRSDTYGVGAILYALLTGRPPFDGSSRPELAEQIENDLPVEPSRCHEEIPALLEAVVMKALSKDPEDRQPSANDLRAELEHAAEAAHITL